MSEPASAFPEFDDSQPQPAAGSAGSAESAGYAESVRRTRPGYLASKAALRRSRASASRLRRARRTAAAAGAGAGAANAGQAAGAGPGKAGQGGRVPAHRGGASPAYNDILHRVLKPPVRQVLNRGVMRVRLEGVGNVPRNEPLIFAGNHSSWLDGPLVVIEAPRTVRCLTKSELYKGVLGRLLLLVGQIPVERGRPDRTALHTALDELARGGAVGVFPEGTRGTGEMASVQHGIAYLAVHGRCRVLPVACVNTGNALPKGARWPKRSVQVRVVFGEPFEVAVPDNPRSRRALAAVAEDIRVHIADHIAAARGMI
jgi:1-acyl-sn-glycerol-3-phosphate acyltransferase